VKRIEIHLDNAGINKSYAIVAALTELCVIGRLHHASLFYLIAGHAKVPSTIPHIQFTPDHIFSKIGIAYAHADVYCAQDLMNLCSRFEKAHYFSADQFLNYAEVLGSRYGAIDQLTKYHIIQVEAENTYNAG
jgi:hypothetical protein